MAALGALLGLGGGEAAAGAGAGGALTGAAAGAGAGAGLSSAAYGAGASLPAAAGGAGVAAFPATLAAPSLFSQLGSNLGTFGTNVGRGLIGEAPNQPGFLAGLGNFAGQQALRPPFGAPPQQSGPTPQDLAILLHLLRQQYGGGQ